MTDSDLLNGDLPNSVRSSDNEVFCGSNSNVQNLNENEINVGIHGKISKSITPDNLLENVSFSDEQCKFSIKELYKFGYKFYKDKSGKAVHLSYEDNCKLVALSQQISQGPYNPATAVTLGVLDVVGRDRRMAWQSLGELSKEDSMKQFVDTLNKLTPTFKPYVEALWADHVEKERKIKEEELQKQEEEEEKKRAADNEKKEDEEKRKQEETKRNIQEALNAQTFSQFKVYAEQQYPGNPEEQAVLVKQLQEQHYQQYMQQVYQQQLLQQQQLQQQQSTNQNSMDPQLSENIQTPGVEEIDEIDSRNDSPCETGEVATEDEMHTDEEGNELAIAPASMWTRRDIKEFKESIKKEGGDSIIKVGHGETVTVRVPTHEDGTCLFWEFATDSYDIGFGVYFEWTKEPSTAVSVHIAESDDDEDDEEPEEETDDVERIAAGTKVPDSNKPPQTIIIPVYRRDCHEEVYAGSHTYPGTGVYLLKFDNSYSLWRNKVLYYRVYYTR